MLLLRIVSEFKNPHRIENRRRFYFPTVKKDPSGPYDAPCDLKVANFTNHCLTSRLSNDIVTSQVRCSVRLHSRFVKQRQSLNSFVRKPITTRTPNALKTKPMNSPAISPGGSIKTAVVNIVAFRGSGNS